jgi:hypothetical protein
MHCYLDRLNTISAERELNVQLKLVEMCHLIAFNFVHLYSMIWSEIDCRCTNHHSANICDLDSYHFNSESYLLHQCSSCVGLHFPAVVPSPTKFDFSIEHHAPTPTLNIGFRVCARNKGNNLTSAETNDIILTIIFMPVRKQCLQLPLLPRI